MALHRFGGLVVIFLRFGEIAPHQLDPVMIDRLPVSVMDTELQPLFIVRGERHGRPSVADIVTDTRPYRVPDTRAQVPDKDTGVDLDQPSRHARDAVPPPTDRPAAVPRSRRRSGS